MSIDLPVQMQVIERDWLNANHVLFLGGENVLVDSGYVSGLPETLRRLKAPDALGDNPLHRIVNTHGHSDHIGGNAGLKRIYGCSIAVPVGEAPLIGSWDTRALWLDYADQECERFVHDAVIRPGDVLSLGGLHWQAVDAPGHDMGALVFHCAEERLLISGDALWENGFGVVMPGPGGDERLAATRATLDALATLDVRAVIPGHGAPFADIRRALDQAYGRLEAFESDPLRMARNCVRVMLVYALLHRGRLPLSGLPDYLERVPVHRECNARYFKLSPQAFADTLVADLEKAGAARRADGYLVPTGGRE